MQSAIYKGKVKTFLQRQQGILIFPTAEKNLCQNDINRFVGEGVEKALAEAVWLSGLSYFKVSKCLYLAFAELTKNPSPVSHEQPRGICINLGVQVSLWAYFGYFMMVWGNAKVLSDDNVSEYVTVKNSPEQGYVLAQRLFITLYAAVLLAASGSRSEGSCFNYFIGGRIANLERRQAKLKVREVLAANVPFAADSELGVQNITDGFDCTAMAQPCHKHKTNNTEFCLEVCWASGVPWR